MSRSRRLSSYSCAVRCCWLSAALLSFNTAACSNGSDAKSAAQAGADNGGAVTADAGKGNPSAGAGGALSQGGTAGLDASGGAVSNGGVSGGTSPGGASALGPTVNDFIGLDAFIDDPMDKIVLVDGKPLGP
jgi:hypothetical protein